MREYFDFVYEEFSDFAKNFLERMGAILIYATCFVWIIPYAIVKKIKNKKQQEK